MANSRGLIQLRKEGFEEAQCDRRMGPFVKDLYGFGDAMGYDPLHLRRPILVNFCLADVNAHITKYLSGGMKENGEMFPPNKHLIHLMKYFDLEIWSFVKRGARGKRKLWECRKWKFIVSPTGQGSFEKEESMHGPELTPEEEAAMQREADAALEMAREARDAKYRAQEAEQNECPECNS